MKIFLWKGYHNPSLMEFLSTVWDNNHLMIFCPPTLSDFSFVAHLPEGNIECVGDWSATDQSALRAVTRLQPEYKQAPILGLFTSGTTGNGHKLVLYSKRNIDFSLDGILRFFDASMIRHVFCYPHPFHTFGLLLGYINAHIHNWEFTPLDGRYSSQFHAQWVESVHLGTLTLGTPTHFKDLIQYVKARDVRPRDSYSCIIGGAPVSPDLWSSVQKELNIQKPSLGYGATEASPALTHLPAGQMPFNAGHIGWPLTGVNIERLSTGGFRFEGPNVCLAQIDRGELVFPKSIVLNDELEMNSDGSYTFLGRTDFILNRGGEKFLLEEIEAFLASSFSIQAVAIVVPDNRLGSELGLLIEIPTDHAPTRDQVRQKLLEKYKTHFNEHLFFYVQQFPVTDSGKLHRRESSRILNDLQRASIQ